MGNDGLNMMEALKFARHDFLNELQLILLYLDLDKKTEARNKLLETTENMRQMAMLERLRLPALESWLMTFAWRYGTFSTRLTSDVISGIRQVDDAVVVAYLNQVMTDVVEVTNPLIEYEVDLLVTATTDSWSITIKIDGALADKRPVPVVLNSFNVQENSVNEQWTFTISGQ